MGIGKGKSDKINIDGLIESTNNESKILQVERSFTENIAELKQTTAVLNAAIDRMESIVSKFNSSAQEMQMKKIDAQVHPQTLKSLNNICMILVVEVGRQFMAHRNKQLELQKEHEKRIKVKEYGFRTSGLKSCLSASFCTMSLSYSMCISRHKNPILHFDK